MAFPPRAAVSLATARLFVHLETFDMLSLRPTLRQAASIALGVLLATTWANAAPSVITLEQYDVVIAGGSTAAIAAAFTAAEEGAKTALLEPTDWIGGQLTASGVPAVDEAWHQVCDPKTGEPLLNVSRIARDPRNMTPFFRDALLAIGNPGRGWVSRFCFQPQQILDSALLPREKQLKGKLTIYRNTVVKSVRVDSDRRAILGLTAIQRTAKRGVNHGGYDLLPSQDLPDWYAPEPSERYDKRTLTFQSPSAKRLVFIDGTEWGELLALTDAPYLQGAEKVDGQFDSRDRCGQAITFGFVQRYHERPVSDHPQHATAPRLGFGRYKDKPDAWSRVWTYRRVYAAGDQPSSGDLSLQNWGYDSKTDESGNDYPYGYLFLSKADTRRQTADWRGGVDLRVMAAAERQAFAWHDWFRHAAPAGIDPDCFTLAPEVLGTGHGLSKLPYIRDTRRSIGLDGFLMQYSDITGDAAQKTGTRFADRVALGAYAADIHPLAGCRYPIDVMVDQPTLPFYIPYRALTNRQYNNLLAAGKTMAQTFLTNSATRLHPIEWSSGCAAGAAAAYLSQTGMSTREGLEAISAIQQLSEKHTPRDWRLD